MYLDLNPEAGVLAVLTIRATSLLGLSIRLRWRQRYAETREEAMMKMVQSLPVGSWLEQRHADGSLLTISHYAHHHAEGSHGGG